MTDEQLIPWFMCAECSEYAPVTDLRIEEEDWLSGEALTYVHRDHDDYWDDDDE